MTLRHRLIAAAVCIGLSTPAFAGPPLLCHPFDIGTATSLPWDGSTGWFNGRADYSVKGLVADTERLLTPATPVVVRMETLRRAAIYASADPKVAQALLDRLTTRASAQKSDALTAGDAAYYVEALREISMLTTDARFGARVDGVRAVIAGADSAEWMRKAVAARPDDAAVAFEAALVTSMADRTASREHAARARAGANSDPLVARNLDHLS